jgi:rifampin ADP-ribosylating transferase
MPKEPAPAIVPRYPSPPPYYHGTRADLKPGDLIGPGYTSNYGKRRTANNVYFSALLEPAIWGAELAVGDGPQRIYIVEPMGPFTDDPNLTDKRFPGNPTRSYCTKQPLRVVDEVKFWTPHSPEQLKTMKEHLEILKQQGSEHIDD